MIGLTVFFFDYNRRVYNKALPGSKQFGGGPIWREHWRPEKVVGETSRSWVTEFGTKLPKKRDYSNYRIAYSREEVDQSVYVYLNASAVADKIRTTQDYGLLKQVAEIIGHKPIEEK